MNPLNYGDGSMLLLFGLGTILNALTFYIAVYVIVPLLLPKESRFKGILYGMARVIALVLLKTTWLFSVFTLYQAQEERVPEILTILNQLYKE